jgi:osmotically-inducible protein OsmY
VDKKCLSSLVALDNALKYLENNMRLVKTVSIATILLGTTLLYGCAPAVVGGAATGASVVHDRRSVGTTVEDQNIEFRALHARAKDSDLTKNSNLSATSYNKVVLLTGQANSEEYRRRYVESIRRIPEVKRVVDEIQIGHPPPLLNKAKILT